MLTIFGTSDDDDDVDSSDSEYEARSEPQRPSAYVRFRSWRSSKLKEGSAYLATAAGVDISGWIPSNSDERLSKRAILDEQFGF